MNLDAASLPALMLAANLAHNRLQPLLSQILRATTRETRCPALFLLVIVAGQGPVV